MLLLTVSFKKNSDMHIAILNERVEVCICKRVFGLVLEEGKCSASLR